MGISSSFLRRRGPRLGCVALGALVLALGSCKAPAPAATSAITAPAVPAQQQLKPRWYYHPASAGVLRARHDLPSGARLFAGSRGERWLVDVASDVVQAAPQLADEDLVGIAHVEGHDYAFVGAKGSVFRSLEPLGPFTQIVRPNKLVRAVAASGPHVLMAYADGTVARSSDAGQHFVEGKLTAPAWDLAVARDGRAMALTIPEQLWLSKDQAATFTPLKHPPMGVRFVSLDAFGTLVAPGLTHSLRWEHDSSEPASSRQPFRSPPMELLADPETGPDAAALISGRALLQGMHYVEAQRPPGSELWSLASGTLGTRLTRTIIDGSKSCKDTRVDAHGSMIALACTARSSSEKEPLFLPVRLLISQDGGLTFQTPSLGLVADEESLSVTVVSPQRIVLTGTCKAGPNGVCVPRLPLVLDRSAASSKLSFTDPHVPKMPPVVGPVGPVRRGAKGRLYATATLADQQLALLISDDEGQSFRATPLRVPKTLAAPELRTANLTRARSGRLSVGAGDRLSWLLHTDNGLVWAVLDREGHLLSAHAAPADGPFLAVAGLHGVAFSEDGRVLESSDGGATFAVSALLPSQAVYDGEHALGFCSEAACVFGSSFSKVGWGKAEGGLVDALSSKNAAEKPHPPTAFHCETVDKETDVIAGAELDITVFDADRASVDWTVVAPDALHATVNVARWSRGRVTVSPLLPPAEPAGMAMAYRKQAEGVAMLRFRYAAQADGRPANGARMQDLEVAWQSDYDGRVRRVTVADAGPLGSSTISAQAGGAALAHLSDLSVSSPGVVVCAHQHCDEIERKTLYLQPGRRPEPVAHIQLPQLAYDGAVVALRTSLWYRGPHKLGIGRDNNMLLTTASANATPSALSLRPHRGDPESPRVMISWALGPKSQLAVMTTWLAQGDGPFARLVPLQPDGFGELLPAPVQPSLDSSTRICTPQDKSGAFRVVAPARAETQRTVHVQAGERKRALTTEQVLMYASSPPCASMLEALSPPSTPPARALVPLGDLEHAWLFTVQDKPAGVRWTRMRCRWGEP